MDANGCDKIVSFLVLCDSYNIPIVFLVDNPGFVIGLEAERQRAPGKIINFMNALQLVTVPKLTIMLRKNYGQAYINMGGNKNRSEEHTSELQSLMRISYAVFCLNKKKKHK